jgi:hypothetical protein
VYGIELEVDAVVADPVDAARIGEHSGVTIEYHGVVVPTLLPKPIDDLYVFS